jgi:hypothetical protein
LTFRFATLDDQIIHAFLESMIAESIEC